MEARPKIKINLTRLDKLLQIGGLILLMIMWALSTVSYCLSPETVPIHFNLSGEPDGYGSKATLLLVPIIATIIYLALTQLIKVPHIYNYTNKITVENAERHYIIGTRTIRILRVAIVLIFAIDSVFTFLKTLGIFGGTGVWFLPLTLVILVVPMLYALYQSQNKKKKDV